MSDTPAGADTAKTLGTLLLLAAAAPVAVVVTVAALVTSRVGAAGQATSPGAERPTAGRRTVLVSGGKMTKALQLARSFHRAGHRVVMVEQHKYRFTGHRFSRAVDSFHTVPAPDADDYAEALRDVVVTEGVDVYVPVCSPAASLPDARAKALLPGTCEVIHPDADTVAMLDDKYAFSQAAAALGLAVPVSYRITDAQQVLDLDLHRQERTFILKSIPYDPVRRLDLTQLPCATPDLTEEFVRSLPISPDQPWILQEFIEGQEYCTHSTVRGGRVQMHCCCRSSASQLNYEMVDHPQIESWVRTFVGALGVTGQLSFDFIESTDGTVRAIECNPRTHSAITMFYDHPGVAAAYLEDGQPVITPLPSSRPTYWLYHEVWRLLTRPRDLRHRVSVLRRGKDAIFDRHDPLPFLVLHHLQIPYLLIGTLLRRTSWVKIDFNIGKLVEPAGD